MLCTVRKSAINFTALPPTRDQSLVEGQGKERLTQADLEYACSNDVQTACTQAGAIRLGDLVPRMAQEIIALWQAHIDAHPREEFLTAYREAHDALHRLWTAAAGKPDYDKKAWTTLGTAFARFGRDASATVGIGPREPIL